MVPSSFKHLFRSASLTLATAILVACGGGGSSNQGSPAPGGGNLPPAGQPPAGPTVGTVALTLRDHPSEYFCRIYADIERIDLLGEDGPTNIFVSMDPSDDGRFDLLDLQNQSALVSIATEVPVGEYEKIRMILDQLSLVECEDEDGLVEEPESQWEHPKLPGNGKVDLNPRETIQVIGGETLLVEIDMDMEKSLKLHQTGNGRWQFRSVIFVTVRPDSTRLVRLFGEVRDTDDSSTFELCPVGVMPMPGDGDMHDDDNSGRCLDVFLLDASSTHRVFDENGDWVGFSGNVVDGGLLTAIGFLALHDDDDDEDDYDDDLKLDALVLQLGPEGGFESLVGSVATDIRGDDIFGFDTTPMDGVVDSLVDVKWQGGPILDVSDNSEVGTDVLLAGAGLEVNGVFTTDEADPGVKLEPLKASLILLEEAATAPSASLLDGVITEILDDDDEDPATREIAVTVGEDDPVCVKTVEGTRYLKIEEVDGSSVTTEIDFEGLAIDDSVDVFGAEEIVDEAPTGCIVADTIQKYPEPEPAP